MKGRQGNEERLTHVSTPKVNKVRYFDVSTTRVSLTHFSGPFASGSKHFVVK